MIFLKKYWREIAIVILVLIVVFSVNTCQRRNDDIKVITSQRDSARFGIKSFINKNNELVHQVETQEITIGQLKDHGIQLGYDNNKLRKQVGNLNNVVAHWKGKAVSTGVVVIPDVIIKPDSSVSVVHPDPVHIDLEFKSGNTWTNGFLTLDSIKFNSFEKKLQFRYQYKTDFSLTAYRKKKLFGLIKGPLVADISFKDPNMVVTDFKGFVVKEPRENFFQKKIGKFTIGVVTGIVFWELIRK